MPIWLVWPAALPVAPAGDELLGMSFCNEAKACWAPAKSPDCKALPRVLKSWKRCLKASGTVGWYRVVEVLTFDTFIVIQQTVIHLPAGSLSAGDGNA